MKEEIKKCNNLKEYMAETLKKYKDRIAYKIKHKEGKNVSYEEITYERYDYDIKALGTKFIEMGLK